MRVGLILVRFLANVNVIMLPIAKTILAIFP